MTAVADVTRLRPIDQFEVEYATQRQRAKTAWLIASVIFLAFFTFSAWLGDFFHVTQVTLPDGSRDWRWIIPAGIPRLGEFIEKTIPTLRWESLGADLAEWFWRWKVWLNLLVETILIAFMATVFGVIGGFLLSFPASRNLAPNKWVLWICRRYLEIARTVPELVFALIFVFCFSVGASAVIPHIGLHAPGAMGMLYPESTTHIALHPLGVVKY